MSLSRGWGDGRVPFGPFVQGGIVCPGIVGIPSKSEISPEKDGEVLMAVVGHGVHGPRTGFSGLVEQGPFVGWGIVAPGLKAGVVIGRNAMEERFTLAGIEGACPIGKVRGDGL